MGVIHLGPLSALPGTCIVLCALAMLYDPGGTCTVLAYRPAHYCLRPKLEYRLPLVVLTRLNRFTLSHYGSRTPLSTLHAGLTASHARLSTGCLLGFAGSGLSPDYTIHAELAHNLRTLRPSGRSILRTFLFEAKNSPFGESIHKGEGSYLSLVRQRPRSQLRRKRRRCSISGVEGSSCSISRMASFSFRPERKMRRYAFFR